MYLQAGRVAGSLEGLSCRKGHWVEKALVSCILVPLEVSSSISQTNLSKKIKDWRSEKSKMIYVFSPSFTCNTESLACKHKLGGERIGINDRPGRAF